MPRKPAGEDKPFSPKYKRGGPGGYVGGRPKDASKLSTDPAQIRRRLRRADKTRRTSEDVRLLIETGTFKPLDKWDLEELARGKPRNKNGQFGGRAPSWITAEVQKECKRRLLDHTFGSLAAHVSSALNAIKKIIESDERDDNGKPIVDARTRLAACQFVIEHVIGKPKAVYEVQAEDFTRRMLASAIILDDGTSQDDPIILEGQVVEDDEEEDASVE